VQSQLGAAARFFEGAHRSHRLPAGPKRPPRVERRSTFRAGGIGRMLEPSGRVKNATNQAVMGLRGAQMPFLTRWVNWVPTSGAGNVTLAT
jgi:hypothetical protein